jgi:hypothetical protein
MRKRQPHIALAQTRQSRPNLSNARFPGRQNAVTERKTKEYGEAMKNALHKCTYCLLASLQKDEKIYM